MSDVRLSTRNITRTFRAATPSDRETGVGWYTAAHRVAAALDPRDPIRAAAVIAVLSPLLPWPRNVTEARNAYTGGPIRALGPNARKALRIVAGEDPEFIVSGPKVRAFWRTIADPAEPQAVVVDRHAIDVAAGRVLGDRVRSTYVARAGAYDAVSEMYRRAARRLSREHGLLFTPATVQAITWVYWRREHAVAHHR